MSSVAKRSRDISVFASHRRVGNGFKGDAARRRTRFSTLPPSPKTGYGGRAAPLKMTVVSLRPMTVSSAARCLPTQPSHAIPASSALWSKNPHFPNLHSKTLAFLKPIWGNEIHHPLCSLYSRIFPTAQSAPHALTRFAFNPDSGTVTGMSNRRRPLGTVKIYEKGIG